MEFTLTSDLHGFLENKIAGRTVLFGGDILWLGTSLEKYRAFSYIENLILNNNLVCTPGNHDIRYLNFIPSKNWFEGLMRIVAQQKHVVAAQGLDMISRFGEDVVVSLSSEHLVKRYIRKHQIYWALDVLRGMPGRLHFLTHRSLWRDREDVHGSLYRQSRLELTLLSPLNFQTYIHGHNHRFVDRKRILPESWKEIRQISIPSRDLVTFNTVTGETNERAGR